MHIRFLIESGVNDKSRINNYMNFKEYIKYTMMRYLKLTLLPLFVGLSISVCGQTTETFTSSTSWLVPGAVTSIDVVAYGAGAGGETKGAGGGGGAYVSTTIAVTPGQTLDILVPAGGAPGTDGGDAEVLLGASTLVRADGGLANGNGGGSIANNVPMNVGANGGAGGDNDKDAGGGGGASGSSAGDGANGTKNKNGGAGGIGVAGGGSGGDGGDKNENGTAGAAPGGGGGAGGKGGISGAGGRAEIQFTYTFDITTDLGLTKTVDQSVVDEGDTVIYTIIVENGGPEDVPTLQVLDNLPSPLIYVSHSGGTYSSGTGIWDITNLNVGETDTLFISAEVGTGSAAQSVDNIVTFNTVISEPPGATLPNTDTATFQVRGADIGVTKTSDAVGTMTEGDTVLFTIIAFSNGPDPATNIEISDYLPNNLDLISHTATQGTYTLNTGIWSTLSLNAGESDTLELLTYIKDGGAFTNTARVLSSSQGDSELANNSSSVYIDALKTYGAGSCIINMSQSPQRRDNTLAAYGLLWTLVMEDKVPVDWVIRPDKDFVSEFNKADQVDYTVNGVNYSSGFFVVDELFVPDALASINQFVAATGVEVNCNQPAFTTAVHRTLTSFPKAVLDQDNGDILEAIFYNHIGVTNQIVGQAPNGDDIYSLYRPNGLPGNLGLCDDIYGMPHADPHIQWSNSDIETFDAFIKSGGFLWAGCHAVSALETYMDIPSIPGGAPQMNYLSVDGLIPWDDGARINTDGTLQYYYNTQTGQGQYYDEIASEPIMQFLGEVDQALKSGSEEIYVPYAAGWRPSTTIAVYDPDHPDILGPTFPTNAAAVVAYGRAFGNPDYGFIVYEGSHSFNSGNESQNVAAARIYGNFLLQAGVEFKPEIVPTRLPQDIIGGVSETFSVEHNPELEYEWFAACGGTFSNPDSSWTTFIPPIQVDTPIRCIMRLTVTDQCGRTNFLAKPYFVYPYADIEVNKVSLEDTVTAGEVINYTITAKNNGPSPSVDLVVRDIIPPNMTVETSTPSFGTWSTPDWTIGKIEPNVVVSLALQLRTDTTIATGCYTNEAFVKSLSIDTVQNNDTARVITCVNNPEILLPVELIQLSASSYENRRIDITWITATEIDNEGFELQRSTDGLNFNKIAWIEGMGNTKDIVNYFHSDYEIESNIVYYYRLKQIDYNGNFKMSNIISAEIKDENQDLFEVDLIPNPSQGFGVVSIKSSIQQTIQVDIYNNVGSQLFTEKVNLDRGINQINLNKYNSTSGIFSVVIKRQKHNPVLLKWVIFN